MSSTPSFVATPKSPAIQIVNADAAAYKTLFSAGANGSRVDLGSIVNSDASNAYVLKLAIKIGSTDFPIGEVAVPAGAGSNGSTKSVSLLNTTDLPQLVGSDGVLFLQASSELRVGAKTTVSGSNTLTVFAQGGDY